MKMFDNDFDFEGRERLIFLWIKFMSAYKQYAEDPEIGRKIRFNGGMSIDTFPNISKKIVGDKTIENFKLARLKNKF